MQMVICLEHKMRLSWLTGYCSNPPCILSSDQENDIPLAGIHIVVLKEVEFVHAIFLELTESHEQPDCSS